MFLFLLLILFASSIAQALSTAFNYYQVVSCSLALSPQPDWAAEGKGHVSFDNPPPATSSYLKLNIKFWITIQEACQVATILILMRFKALWVICFYPCLPHYTIGYIFSNFCKGVLSLILY